LNRGAPNEGAMNTAMGIEARFQCRFEDFALDVTLTLPGTGVTALFGHSGCGKTTLLRCMAGLQPAQGRMVVNGECWQEDDFSLPVHRRPLAYVFQDTGLFPHLSVAQNLHYGYRRIASGARQIDFDQAVRWLGLERLLDRMPQKLSGGERQRVAIARALLTSPRLLLMDEPLSALDDASKQDILPYLERLHDSLSIPVIYVSHATGEVARLADHIVMMAAGKVTAQGPLQETLARTDQPFAGEDDAAVIVKATITGRDDRWHLCLAEFGDRQIWLRDDPRLSPGDPIRLQVLARDVSIALNRHRDQSIQNLLPARVEEIRQGRQPGTAIVRLVSGDTPFLSQLTSRAVEQLALSPGMAVWLQIKSVAIVG